MSIEINKRVCKICNKEKDHILVGKFDNRNKKYHDGTGKCWNGNVCPQCHVEQVRTKMKLSRSLKIGGPY